MFIFLACMIISQYRQTKWHILYVYFWFTATHPSHTCNTNPAHVIDLIPSMETTWSHSNNTSVQHCITDNHWQNGFLSLHSRLCVYKWVLIYHHHWLLAVSHIGHFEMSLVCYYNQHSIKFTRLIQPAWVHLKSPFYNMANKAYQHYCL